MDGVMEKRFRDGEMSTYIWLRIYTYTERRGKTEEKREKEKERERPHL